MDEFHNVESYPGLKEGIKLIIDKNQSPPVTPHPVGGGIVAAGSHQQNMIRLLADSTEPLYRHIRGRRLKQLTTTPLLEMATEQGWLVDPRQFLTLY